MHYAIDGFSPAISPTAFVHPDSTVIGQVVIGKHSSIWPQVVLRGDMGGIIIGDETSIQDGSICHMTTDMSTTRIGNRVTVGHGVILHGCIVEDECLIGMGAILLDNCVIGKGSLIGAGALITVGKIIPPNSVVLGNPGKIVRQTSAKETQMIEEGWKSYINAGKSHQATLDKIASGSLRGNSDNASTSFAETTTRTPLPNKGI